MVAQIHFDPLPRATPMARADRITHHPIPRIARMMRARISIAVLAIGVFAASGLVPPATAAVGDVDPLFDPSPGPYPTGDMPGSGASMWALASGPEGQLIFGGQFTKLGSLVRSQFARIDWEGRLLVAESPNPPRATPGGSSPLHRRFSGPGPRPPTGRIWYPRS